jgi:ribosomal protein S18 acetylase RimI-like enzyme
MVNSGVHVRPATTADLPALLAFGAELRESLLPAVHDGPRPRGTPATAKALLETRYREALADPDRHLVVAVSPGEETLGMALFTVASASPLVDCPAVHVSHVVVADRHKRRGAGKALVAAAAAYAEQRAVEQLVVSVHPGSRDANRFFARLGFAPLAVRRVAPVGVVRRRLAGPQVGVLDGVVQRRPRRGRRTPVSAVPLGAAEPES